MHNILVCVYQWDATRKKDIPWYTLTVPQIQILYNILGERAHPSR